MTEGLIRSGKRERAQASSAISKRFSSGASESSALSGFFGETTSTTSSQPTCSATHSANAICPRWTGLNEPK